MATDSRLAKYLEEMTLPFWKGADRVLRFFFKRWYLLIMLVAVILLASSIVRSMLLLIVLFVLASVSLIYNRWLKVSLGFEFIMMATILTGVRFGPVAGALMGFFSLFTAELLAGRFTGSTVISLIAIVAVGFLTQFFKGAPIFVTGMALVIIYDAIIAPLYILTGSSPGRTGLFVLTHIIWNIWVFLVWVPIIISLFGITF